MFKKFEKIENQVIIRYIALICSLIRLFLIQTSEANQFF